MEKTWKPRVSGILMLIAVAYFPFQLFLFTVLWPAEYRPEWLGPTFLVVAAPVQMAIMIFGFSGTSTLLPAVFGILWVLGVLTAIVGGFYTLRRKIWGLALVGSIGALLCSPYFGIPAIVLTALSKKEFE